MSSSEPVLCTNCGGDLPLHHCPACGQKRFTPHHLGLGHLFHHLFHELVHLDGKIWSTLRTLFTRPGQLSLDYLEGRHQLRVNPFRLFLVGMGFFLFLGRTSGGFDFREILKITPNEWLHQHLLLKAQAVGVSLDTYLGQLSGRWEFLFKLSMSLSIPFLAFLLRLLYRKRRTYYAEYLIPVLHSETAVMLAGSLVMVTLNGASKGLGLTPSQTGLLGIPLMLALEISYGFYLAFAYRRVFGGSLGGGILAAFVLELAKLLWQAAGIILSMVYLLFS